MKRISIDRTRLSEALKYHQTVPQVNQQETEALVRNSLNELMTARHLNSLTNQDVSAPKAHSLLREALCFRRVKWLYVSVKRLLNHLR